MNTQKTPMIVLTGGPCAGKTTVLSFFQQRLSDLGYVVITVSEAATDFILSGLKPTTLGSSQFQLHLLQHITEKEDRWKKIADLIPTDKKVVICDRGTADGAAYVNPREFELILGDLGCNMMDLHKRYDAVIFLQSVAVDKPELYVRANNLARSESVDQALALDRRTFEAWNGHPQLQIIGNSADMAGKSNRAFQAVCRVLGIPVPLEIEYKYLVSGSFHTFSLVSVQRVDIVQDYLEGGEDPHTEERVRIRSHSGGSAYYYTVKQGAYPAVRTKREYQITREEYYTLLRRADPGFATIKKTRHCFPFKDQYYELDVFHNPQGLVLLEVEPTEKNDTIILPDFLKDHVTDVTGSPQYSNREIARRLAEGKEL